MLPEGYRAIARPGLFSLAQKKVVVGNLQVADSSLKRMVGLLGRAGMDADEGLLILPCSGIHMFFMRFAIDAVFMDKSGCIMKIVSDLRPWRMAFCRGARGVLELPAGAATRQMLQEGDSLCVIEQECRDINNE